MVGCGVGIIVIICAASVFLLVLGAMSWSYLNETSPAGGTTDNLRNMAISSVALSVAGFVLMFFFSPWRY